MAFKLKSGNIPAFKKIGGSPLNQEKTFWESRNDSTASYNMQLEKNKLIRYHNREMLATNPRNVKGYVTPVHNFMKETGGTVDDYKKTLKTGEEMIAAGHKLDYKGNPINPNAKGSLGYYSSKYALTDAQEKNNKKLLDEITHHRLNAEKAKEKYANISDKQRDLGIYLPDEMFRMGRHGKSRGGIGSDEWDEDVRIGPNGWYYSIGGEMGEHTTSFRDPTYEDVKLYRPHSNTDDLRPKATSRVRESMITMPRKELQSIPTKNPSFKPTRAIPQELTESDHFTIQRVGVGSHTYPKGDDSRALIKLKDQAGREVFRGSQTEYQEKYGDMLQRGTKKYGKKDLQRRLYIKNK